MLSILDVDTVFFTLLGYPMSYIEFFGTIFYAISVWLAVKNKVLTWPISIVGVTLFAILFFQIQLYSDLLEQFYYLATAAWGWWVWVHPKSKEQTDQQSKELVVSTNSGKANLICAVVIGILTVITTALMSNLHLILPNVFQVAASYPLLDSFTTIMSFVGTYLLIRRKIENWYLWIAVDVIAVWLYYQKDVLFLSLLYACFLVAATKGFFEWRKILKNYEH